MNEHPFAAFIDLISLDQEIRSAHEEVRNLRQETEQLLAQKQELIDRFDQFKKHVHELRKTVHQHELTIKELDEKEKEKKKQLESVTNPKLYQPLKKEIDQLKQAQHDEEAALMVIWNKLEVAQKELEEQQISYNNKIEDLHNQIAANQEKIEALKRTVEEKNKERPAKESGIPAEWLDKYTHMRMRVPDPVVEVLAESCGSCSYTIPNQDMIRLKRRALIQCKGCFRLLYLKEAMEQARVEEPSTKAGNPQ